MLLDLMLLDSPKKSIEALLPLFHDKAATPEMIHHGMNLLKKNTEHLNPQQVPAMVVDQPLYDLAKKNAVDLTSSEDKFVVMLGGLHIELALWSTMGDLLRGSGWPGTLITLITRCASLQPLQHRSLKLSQWDSPENNVLDSHDTGIHLLNSYLF